MSTLNRNSGSSDLPTYRSKRLSPVRENAQSRPRPIKRRHKFVDKFEPPPKRRVELAHAVSQRLRPYREVLFRTSDENHLHKFKRMPVHFGVPIVECAVRGARPSGKTCLCSSHQQPRGRRGALPAEVPSPRIDRRCWRRHSWAASSGIRRHAATGQFANRRPGKAKGTGKVNSQEFAAHESPSR